MVFLSLKSFRNLIVVGAVEVDGVTCTLWNAQLAIFVNTLGKIKERGLKCQDKQILISAFYCIIIKK